MNDRDTRRYEMFNRVRTFGQQRASDFAPNSKAAGHFTNLGYIIQSLDQARAAQRGDGSTASKAAQLDALRLDLANVNRTARAMAQDEPGFAAAFRLPDHNNQSEILGAADAVLSRLQANTDDSAAGKAAKIALVARFVAYELPPDFVEVLAADRAAVAKAQNTQDNSQTLTVESTASVSSAIDSGLKEVANLDAIMHNKYATQPEIMRAWTSAAHVERSPHHAKAAPAAAAPAGAPA